MLPADGRFCLARDLLKRGCAGFLSRPRVAIFVPLIGRVPQIRDVVHPKLMGMRGDFRSWLTSLLGVATSSQDIERLGTPAPVRGARAGWRDFLKRIQWH